jgi:beta-1,4-galactosyltransferase 1
MLHVFVSVEQYGSGPFNRAMLMNVGAAEALKQYDYQCFIFHDVDLLPEDDRNLVRIVLYVKLCKSA